MRATIVSGLAIALAEALGLSLVYRGRPDVVLIGFGVTLAVYLLAAVMRPRLEDAGGRHRLATDAPGPTGATDIPRSLVSGSAALVLPCMAIGLIIGAWAGNYFKADSPTGCIGYVEAPSLILVVALGILLMAVVPEFVADSDKKDYRAKLPYLRNALYATVAVALLAAMAATAFSLVFRWVRNEWPWDCGSAVLWVTAPITGSLIFATIGFALAAPTIVSQDRFKALLRNREVSSIRHPGSGLGIAVFVIHVALLVWAIAERQYLRSIGATLFRGDPVEAEMFVYFVVLTILAVWAVLELTVIRLWSSRRAIYFGHGFRALGWFAYAASWTVAKLYDFVSLASIALSAIYLLRLPWTLFKTYEASITAVSLAEWLLLAGAAALVVPFIVAANTAEREDPAFQQHATRVFNERVSAALDHLYLAIEQDAPAKPEAGAPARASGPGGLLRAFSNAILGRVRWMFLKLYENAPQMGLSVRRRNLAAIAWGLRHAIHHEAQLDVDTPHRSYLILSDLHRGARNLADDFRNASWVYLRLLRHLTESSPGAPGLEGLPRDTHLALNGDVDELWEENYADISAAYGEMIGLERRLSSLKRYLRTFGNHDVDYRYYGSPEFNLLTAGFGPGETLTLADDVMPEMICIPVSKSGQLIGRILITHGHQGEVESDRYEIPARSFVRLAWAGIQNVTGVSRNVFPPEIALGTRTDRAIAAWAAQANARPVGPGGPDGAVAPFVVVAGHTHWPYAWAPEHATTPDGQYHYARAPFYFNSGCSSFIDGTLTGILITNGRMGLVKFSKDQTLNRVRMDALNAPLAIDEVFRLVGGRGEG